MSRLSRWVRLLIAGSAAAALSIPVTTASAVAGPPPPAGVVAAEGDRPGIDGASIQVDPGFAYYQGRSAESIADEIVQRGYETVRIFVVNENDVRADVVAALQERGIFVWAMVLGNGSYSVAGWPAEHTEWLMELVTPVDDGYYRFSPFSDGYVDYKKDRLTDLLTRIPFDGFEIAESYLPDWNAIDRGYYGDVGPHARAAFAQAYPQFGEIPDFEDPASPLYYQTDLDRYEAWMQFRVDGVNAYQDEIINGAGGVRETRPDIKVATWSLGVTVAPGQDPVTMQREFQGLDAAAMIEVVEPDLHVIQTNWPDWIRDDLTPDYIGAYQPFIDQIRAAHPDIPLGVQADIGSQVQNQQTQAWLDGFAQASEDLGFATWTAYEYHIGDYIYTDAPRPVEASCSAGTVRVSFDKRIDPASARQPGAFTVADGSRTQTGSHVLVDGNIATFRLEEQPGRGAAVSVSGVTDMPSTWLRNHDAAPNVVAEGESVGLACGDEWQLPPGEDGSFNVALGAAYTVSTPAASAYPDASGELTDGLAGSPAVSDPAWQGRADAGAYSVTVDLGAESELARLESVHLRETLSGVLLPTSAHVEASTDGAAFASLGTITLAATGDPESVVGRLTLAAPVSARFVRFTFDGPGWSFLSELRAFTAPNLGGPGLISAPTVAGTAYTGHRLTTDGGRWEPEGVTLVYQWTRDGVDIAGATRASYRVSGRDAGTTLAVRVTATADELASVTAVSDGVFVRHRSLTRLSLDRSVVMQDRSIRASILVTAGAEDVADTTVTVRVGGTHHDVPLVDGRAELTLRDVVPGVHVVTATYPGSDTAHGSTGYAVLVALR